MAPDQLRQKLHSHSLKLAAVGTGAGWVVHKLTLTDPDATIRRKAAEFIRSMIDFGGANGAPAIIAPCRAAGRKRSTRPLLVVGWVKLSSIWRACKAIQRAADL